MSTSLDRDECTRLVLNSNTDGEMLHEISQIDSLWVLQKIIDHPNVLIKTIERLKGSNSEGLYSHLLKSKFSTDDMLISATHHSSSLVIEAALDSGRMPKEGLLNIIKGFSQNIGGGQYRQPCINIASGKKIGGEMVSEVSLELAKLNDSSIIESMVMNANTSTEAIDYIANIGSAYVLTYIASHPKTSMEVLNQLLSSDGFPFIEYVLNNPALPSDLIREISQEKSINAVMAIAIAKHPNTPADVINRLADTNFLYPNGLDDEMDKRQAIEIMCVVAKSKSLSAEAAKALLKLKSPRVNKSIACNQHADIKTLIQLIVSNSTSSLGRNAEGSFLSAMPRYEEATLNGALHLSDVVATFKRKPISLGDFLQSKGDFINAYERLIAKELERSVLERTSQLGLSGENTIKTAKHKML